MQLQETHALKHQKELKKMRLKYEILARNEINSRLSEMNTFLHDRQKEQDLDEKKKAEATDTMQNDLARRLQISRDELSAIKDQMKGNARVHSPIIISFSL